VDAVKGRLAHTEDKASALLEADVGGAFDEIRGHAVGDASERAHGAGKDDHAIGGSAAAGDAGCNVCLGMLSDFFGDGRRAEKFFRESSAATEVHLFGEDAQCSFAGDQVNLGDTRVGVEGAEHLGGKEGTAGSGDGESEAEIGGCRFGGVGHEVIIADLEGD